MRLILAACHRGLAAVVVATRNAQLDSWADRVVFFRDGRIVDQTLPIENPEAVVADLPNHRHLRGVLERPSTRSAPNRPPGECAARRAMVRWAWRLFNREWRQRAAHPAARHRRRGRRRGRCGRCRQHAAAVQHRVRHGRRPGHLHELRERQKQSPNLNLHSVDAQIATLEHRFGKVQVIENETFNVPGSTQTYQLRAEDPHGPYGGPMLQLLSGHYPTGPNQIALTPGLASELNLRVGDTWSQGTKTVVGIVQNPPEPAR